MKMLCYKIYEHLLYKCIDGSLASSDQEKDDLLNSYFSIVFTRENLSNIPNFEVNEDIPLLDNISISPSMVWTEINKLKSEKSAGPDGWPIQVLKQCSQQILCHCPFYLTNPFNLVISSRLENCIYHSNTQERFAKCCW